DDPYLEASIAPTLRGGDLVILWRLTKPSVGDLVLCPEPAEASEDGEMVQTGRIVIGRVVGEAGDSIEIAKGKISVNGKMLRTESSCVERTFTINDPETEKELEQHCALERIGSNVHMVGGGGRDVPMPRDRGDIVVGDAHVWLASDNRMVPYDSRDFGEAERASCKETIVFRLVSAKGFFDTPNRLTLIR